MWRVMVVDEDLDSRNLILEILKEKADCVVATNGKQAIDIYDLSFQENKLFDAILLDTDVSEIDGLSVLEHIRVSEKSRRILLGKGILVFMTSANKKAFTKSFFMGCDDYILKPINRELLIKKIKNKINERRDENDFTE